MKPQVEVAFQPPSTTPLCSLTLKVRWLACITRYTFRPRRSTVSTPVPLQMFITSAWVSLACRSATIPNYPSCHVSSPSRVPKSSDEVRRILIDELLRTFVTPIDREDIFALSRAIDDVIDYANTTMDEVVTIPATALVAAGLYWLAVRAASVLLAMI